MTAALLIIDVQTALCTGPSATFEAERVIRRINDVSARMRAAGGLVVVIQHESPEGPFVHGSQGWKLAPDLVTAPTDVYLRKTATDSFHRTDLETILRSHGITRLIVCGMQSDFCVDTTVRRALALGFPVTLVADGHTTVDNEVLTARQITAHHNATLANITSFGPRAEAVPADLLTTRFFTTL